VATALTSSAFAGLTISSKGIDQAIQVSCNGAALPYVMQPNSNINNIAWYLITLVFNGTELTCDFSLTNDQHTHVGTAQLSIDPQNDEGKVTNVQYAADYSVTVDPGMDVFAHDITATISKK
jgi:hypothetical protein